MIFAILLFSFGLFLSAFFSGSETGLYRVSRTRLVLDGLGGSGPAKRLIWLLNRPTVFVATTLVGNNVANFVTSFSVVLAVSTLFGHSSTAELLGPMMMTPFVFVFGELLPKHWFYQAPHRLLMRIQGLLLMATILFLPISLFLGLLGRILQGLTGQTPFRLRLAMTRGELDQVFKAGQDAGLLEARQRSLTHSLFEIGNQAAASFGVPPGRLPTVESIPGESGVDIEKAQREARRINHPLVLVRREQRVIGYLRFSEICNVDKSSRDARQTELRPVIRGRVDERHLSLLLKMYDAGSEIALLEDKSGQTKFCVTRRQLLQPLLKED